MKTIISLFIIMTVFFICGCAKKPYVSIADQNCLDKGGELKHVETPETSYTFCKFSDGSVCPTWSFLNDECFKGKCMPECQKQGTDQEGYYDSCFNALIEYTKCGG